MAHMAGIILLLQRIRVDEITHAFEDGKSSSVCTAVERVGVYEAFRLEKHLETSP